MFIGACGGGGGGSEEPTNNPNPPIAKNNPPSIAGSPQSDIAVGQYYSFTPQATDPDGDRLTFSIENKPRWLGFDSITGQIYGSPDANDEGVASGMTITVTDTANAKASLAFTITVRAASWSNSAPAMSGTPPSSVLVGDSYSFTPEASDPNGSPLTFSIQNAPGWASFNTSTGQLTGNPKVSDIGTYTGIVISASNGSQTTSLPAFAVAVTQVGSASISLSWTPPTHNVDGSPLDNLVAYRFYYGTESGNYTHLLQVDNPGLSNFVIDNLSPGRYYIVATAVNSTGIESQFSNEAYKDATSL